MRIPGVRPVWRILRRPRVQDRLLTIAVALPGLYALPASFIVPVASPAVRADAAAVVLGALALLARRSRPLLVALTTVALDITTALFTPFSVAEPASLVAFYTLGRYTPARLAWLTALATAIAEGFAMWATKGSANQVGNGLMLLLAVGVGHFFRLRYELRERRELHAAENAVRAERRRIARELHDVVAHHISVINVLVGAGRTTMATDPARAQEVLVTAERTAREAMSEMRELLHVLRAEDDKEPEDHSGVGAAEVATLVEQARAAGLPAALTIEGEPAPLPAAVDHAVYRIVQESLTNTRKHAPGARASVHLIYEEEAVAVEVLDDGTSWTPGGRDATGAGYGLSGMAERVALCGGQLQTGPRPRGGFRVHARMPVPGHAAQPPPNPERRSSVDQRAARG
ncbi:histidine kinase [Spongiactinospora gelatinilytica]|uniref:histidine kinase n=1 Tax=Spongiactinospora gelatinilytica TaxID=2666298 RepID=A0A2W2GJU7_9ACTN|nr:histidine kinase [Spongiactinospora gelatinilytica]PZG37398.1 histidine kinase [Spongiactinospora gelatinilytica]